MADWRDLVIVSYAVQPREIAHLAPAGAEIDCFGSGALLSVVGFRFLRTRVLGVPLPFHRDFDEVNLRTYVRRTTASGEVRRGVVFVRELVPRRAIAIVARVVYDEPYAFARMRSRISESGNQERTLEYTWRARAHWGRVEGHTLGACEYPKTGSEAAFVTRRNWGSGRRRDGSTVEYEVSHPDWRTWESSEGSVDGDFSSLFGEPFSKILREPPTSTVVAEGSSVTVYRPTELGERH